MDIEDICQVISQVSIFLESIFMLPMYTLLHGKGIREKEWKLDFSTIYPSCLNWNLHATQNFLKPFSVSISFHFPMAFLLKQFPLSHLLKDWINFWIFQRYRLDLLLLQRFFKIQRKYHRIAEYSCYLFSYPVHSSETTRNIWKV